MCRSSFSDAVKPSARRNARYCRSSARDSLRYLDVYSRMRVTWRLALGEVDGEPGIVLLHFRDATWEIAGVIRVEVDADGRIGRIADYQHCPWVLMAGSIIVQESVA